MSRLMTVAIALGLLCALAGAEGGVPAGIYTEVWYDGKEQDSSYITCWRSQRPWLDWVEYYPYQFTRDQNWPPDYHQLRWGHSSLGQPRIPIDTGYLYTFKAKKFIEDQWWYSNWSSAVDYSSPTVYARRVLELSLTTDPGDASNIAIDD